MKKCWALIAVCIMLSVGCVHLGESETDFSLGWKYDSLNKDSLASDDEKSVQFYRTGAEKGNAACQRALAWHYEHGKGVKKDLKEAIKWYEKSAEKGDDYSINILKNLKNE